MAIMGLIPFVYAAIKKKRKSVARDADRYAGIATGGTAAWGHEHAPGAYHSQSCHFTVRPSAEDELGFPYDLDGAARRPPPKEKDLSRWRELFPADRYERQVVTGVAPACGREDARFDAGGYLSQSCRFAVHSSPVDGLVVSREHGASRCLPAQAVDVSRHLVLPARSNGSAYQSQSCRFAVRHSAAHGHGSLHDGVASQPSEDLSGKLLLLADRIERGVSRSMRHSSMRVFAFAWVSGA